MKVFHIFFNLRTFPSSVFILFISVTIINLFFLIIEKNPPKKGGKNTHKGS